MAVIKVCMECGEAFPSTDLVCPTCGLEYGDDLPPVVDKPPPVKAAKPTAPVSKPEKAQSRGGRPPKTPTTAKPVAEVLKNRADVTFPYDIWRNSYLTILTPGKGPGKGPPFCPAEPKKVNGVYSTEREDVLNWVEAVARGGQERQRNYTISAILYFVDCFWDCYTKDEKVTVNPEYVKVKQIIRDEFLGGSY